VRWCPADTGPVPEQGPPHYAVHPLIANTDLRGVAFRRLEEGIRRRLDRARSKFDAIKSDAAQSKSLQNGEGQQWAQRVKQVEDLFGQVEMSFNTIAKLLKLKSHLSWKL